MGRRYYDCNYCNAYPSYLLAQWILAILHIVSKGYRILKIGESPIFSNSRGVTLPTYVFFNFLRGERGGREEEGKGRQEGRKEREKGRGERGFK